MSEATTRPSDSFIGDMPPSDGREWDRQCARCGSSADWQTCDRCAGAGVDGHECLDDCCVCLYPEENATCDTCLGEGGWSVCLSSKEFCEANPLEGREQVRRGAIEWFTISEAHDAR